MSDDKDKENQPEKKPEIEVPDKPEIENPDVTPARANPEVPKDPPQSPPRSDDSGARDAPPVEGAE